MCDWERLWRTLASRDTMAGDAGEQQMVARWRQVARELDSGERNVPDPLLDFVISRLEPGTTVLDIGAGVGRWTMPIAARVRQVTAIEPAAGMRQVLSERLAGRAANVEVVASPWMEAEVGLHDVAVSVHAVYTSPDLLAFARKMEATARRACYLVLRVPAPNGVIGELSQLIHGEWHDSPNFIVGYNLLLAAGFRPNTLIEPPLRYWTDAIMDEAIARARRHLHLPGNEHEDLIRDVLSRRLVARDGALVWPDHMRSGLVWWETP